MALDVKRLAAAMQGVPLQSPANPYAQTIANQQERLAAVGETPAPPEMKLSPLQKIINVLDTPARLVQTGIFGEDRGAAFVESLVGTNPTANAIGNFLLGMGLDPLTYIGLGSGSIAKGATASAARAAAQTPRALSALRALGKGVKAAEGTALAANRTLPFLKTAVPTAEKTLQLRAAVPFFGKGVTLAESTAIPKAVAAATAPLRGLPAVQRLLDNTARLLHRFPITERDAALRPGVERAVEVTRDTATRRTLASGQAAKVLEKSFSKITAPEREQITRYLSGQVGDIAPHLKDLSDEVAAGFADLVAYDNAGLMRLGGNIADQQYTALKEYVPIMLKNPAERKKFDAWLTDFLRKTREPEGAVGEWARVAQPLADEASGRLHGLTNPVVVNARSRFFKTIAAAQKAGWDVELDIQKITQARVLNSMRAQLNGDLILQLRQAANNPRYSGIRTYSAEQAVAKGYKSLDPYMQGLPGYWHPDIVHAVQNLDNLITNVDELNAFAKATVQLTNFWRRSVLAQPGFVVAEAMGSTVTNTYLSGIPLGQIPRMTQVADRTLKHAPQMPIFISERLTPRVAGKAADVVKIGKRQINLQRAANDFTRLGGNTNFSRGAYRYADVGAEGAQKTLQGISKAYDAYTGAFMGAAGAIDTNARMAIYLWQLGQGKTAKEAMTVAKKFIFDSSDLSRTEQMVRGFAVPFYTFTRKQLPLLMQAIYEHPAVYTIPNHLRRSLMQAQDISEEELPEYARQKGALPFRVGENVGFLNPRLATEILGFEGSGRGALRNAISMLNPALSAPIELAANRQMFSDAPIRSREFQTKALPGGLRVSPEAEYLFRQLPFPLISASTGIAGAVGDALGIGEERRVDTSGLPERIPPNSILNILRNLGLRSFYNEVTPERQKAVFQMLYRDLLANQIQSLQKDRGINVPTIQELRGR